MSLTVDELERVEGVRLALRLVELSDAAYIQGLRTNPAYNAHLSKVSGTVDDQRAWIEAYREREVEGREYYYVIERLADGMPCGVVRLYDIGEHSFTWGSWILDENKPRKAALESALLSFGAGFDCLGLATALIDVRRDNRRALNFYRRLGMEQIGADANEIHFLYSRVQFDGDRAGFLEILARE